MKIKTCCLVIAVMSVIVLFFNYYAFSEIVEPQPTDQQSAKMQETVTLDFKNAELSNVLRSLSHSYDLNLVATKDIKGKVTVSLKDVTVDEALQAILSVNGYVFTRKGNIIYITPGPGVEGIDLKTAAIPLKYLTASEASSLLQKTVSTTGDIRINEATNSILITDYPAFIDKAKEVLREIDIQPIQVLIEAKLVDITESDRWNFGTSVTVNYEPLGVAKGLFERETTAREVLAGATSLSGPSTTLANGQLKITAFTLKDLSATATIDALVQDNKAHLLASPSIATLNGKEARIIIGERYPYKEKTQTTTGTTETTKFVDIGTTLRVTPQVSPDGWITMIVHPEVSSLAEELDAGPRITTREADATIRVRNGQTIVIGGLIKRQDDRTKGGVPVLSNIPVVGWLFSNKSKDVTVTELVVFITPRIIRTPEELEAIGNTRKDEVHVSIDGVGERVLVSQLWLEAQDLERDTGAISMRKDEERRMSEALDRYKQIASQFPRSDRADNALYDAASISYNYFKDLELARRYYIQLIEKYPESPYYNKSKRMVSHIDRRIAASEKRRDQKSEETKGEKKSVFPLRFD